MRQLTSVRPVWLVAALAIAIAIVIAFGGSPALSQQQQKQKTSPKHVAPAAQKGRPATPPAQAARTPEQQQPNLIYSPWTKFCLKGQEANAKQVCFTGKDARVESGLPVVTAVLIEPEADPKKVLRVTLPLGMRLSHGTRIIIDQSQPAVVPYDICFTNGCTADYDVTADTIKRLKNGKQLAVQAINSSGEAISLGLPLTDFAKAYDGPPTDPKVVAEQQKKLVDELSRRAAEHKLETQKTTGSETPK